MNTAQQSNHLCIGQLGEDLAQAYLVEQGYQILARNWRLGHKELDLVAIDQTELVAVEVKTRTEPVLDHPLLSVDRKKQRFLITAANAFVRYHHLEQEVRFDIVWVRIALDGSHEISHYKGAFIPML